MVYWQDALLRKVGSTPTVAFSLSLKNMKKQNLEIKYLPVADLIPYARNSRTHTPEQVAQIASSIKEFGFTNPVLIDSEKGIIAGHGRVMGAQKLGLKEVPTIEVTGWTDAQKRAYIIADNKLALNAGWDEEILRLEFEELKDGAFDLELTGFDTAEIDEILDVDVSLDDVEEDEVPEPPVVPKSQLGDVWTLGNHRVMCGDSTDAQQVATLMCGEKANLLFTDPPYGVSVVKDNKVGADFGIAKKGHYQPIIADDSIETAEKSFAIGSEFSDKQIIWGGNYFTTFLPFSDSWLIWDKRVDSGIRNTFADAEMAWCSFHTPVRVYHQLWNGMIREGESGKRVHPTQKPIKTLSEILSDFTKVNDLVLDLFGGSGSTLIACEQTNRIARLMEFAPHYVDVIITRWQELTGLEAVRQDGVKFNDIVIGE